MTANKLVVVGVGASAGGLEAFQQFLTGLPNNHKFVVALVQHLDPNHESLMPELISARTQTPVHSATDGMTVTPGHIYLIPPGFQMEIEGAQLKLSEFERPRGLRRPIDRFFESLAKSHGENAVAVILSGTGSDGSEGAREVKGAGGMVFVQDPREAKYDGMPQSAIDKGAVDVVVKAGEIIDVIRDCFDMRSGINPDLIDDDTFIERIMRHVRFQTGHDFVGYKQGTLLRRIAIRMSVQNITAPADYLRHLIENKREAELLFQDLLINVTSFFRDPAHFEKLQRDIIPEIVERTEPDGEIRIWVAGCSTGEEAYSLGVLLSEEISRTKHQCKVVIFATDIDEKALAHARMGRYSDSIATAIPAEFLERYFRPTSDGYEVGNQLRETVRFSRHSFIKDPPFSKMDLISCRNVLIYMKDVLQEASMRVFHYGLNEGGFLFLGPSENPSSVAEYFDEFSSRSRIFVRLPGPSKPLNLGAFTEVTRVSLPKILPETGLTHGTTHIQQSLIDHHLPPHIHIDRNGEVIFSSDEAAKYLSLRPGRIKTGIFDIIGPELETVVRRLVRTVEKNRKMASAEFQGEIAGAEQRIILTIEKLIDGTLLLVAKDQLDIRNDLDIQPNAQDSAHDEYIRQLEIELDEAKRAVRSTVEELETSNEELKSSNEEMMSMNEELQSGNEELTTINDELQEKVRELNQVNLDLSNFVDSARVATVFLDEGLHLRSYTPEAETYFNFKKSDVGRKLDDLNSILNQEEILELCRETAGDRQERESELISKDGNIYVSARIMPYNPDDQGTKGVVFTLVDNTNLKKSLRRVEHQNQIAEQRLHELEQLYQTSPNALALIGADLKYIRLNKQMAEINGEPVSMHINRSVRDIIPALADETEKTVTQVLKTQQPVSGLRIMGNTKSEPDVQRVWESDWNPFISKGEVLGVTVQIREVTREIEMAERLTALMQELEHRMKNTLATVSALVNRAESNIDDQEDAFETLKSRIQALSRTNALLTAEQWSSANLSDIITPETVDVYGDERVQLSGPEMRVNAQAALALGMVFHELATNSAKYGALSKSKGTTDIEWHRVNDKNGDRLVINWLENGGPAVKKPETKGFGSQLLTSTLNGRLGGDFSIDWRKKGVIIKMELDYDEVSAINVE